MHAYGLFIVHQIAVARRTIARKEQGSKIGCVTHGDKIFANIHAERQNTLCSLSIPHALSRNKQVEGINENRVQRGVCRQSKQLPDTP